MILCAIKWPVSTRFTPISIGLWMIQAFKMKSFLASNPKGKHGSHEYSLEDFDLSEDEVSEEFKDYYSFLEKMNYEK